jgi:hypothetical protein
LDSCYRQMLTPGRKWRGLTEWTRTDTKVNRLFSQFATAEAILYLQGLFSPDEERSQGGVQTVDEGQAAHELQSSDEERSAGEPQGEVQSVDEGQAAHELQSPDEERPAGEPQAEVQSVGELQAAHELPYSHSSELRPPYLRPPYSHSSE